MKGHVVHEMRFLFNITLHDDIALVIKDSLPYFLVFTVLTFNKPFEELEFS